MCILEKRLEDDALKYTLGPSMMEPDSRIETNKRVFVISILQSCTTQENRLPLGLVIDTHLMEQNEIYVKCMKKKSQTLKRNGNWYFRAYKGL